MKAKFLIGLLLSSTIFTGCDKINPPPPYELKDTWGENGDWGKSVKVAQKPKTQKPVAQAPKPVKQTPIPKPVETSQEKPVASETPPETSNGSVSETNEPESEGQMGMVDNSYSNARYSYSVNGLPDWTRKDPIGPVGAYYVKEKDGTNLSFSVGVIKNLTANRLNQNFKDFYLKQLSQPLPNLQIISNEEAMVKGKKAWLLNYTFERGNNRMQQKQFFIPQKGHTLVLNWISTEEGFFKGEDDFKMLTNEVVIN